MHQYFAADKGTSFSTQEKWEVRANLYFALKIANLIKNTSQKYCNLCVYCSLPDLYVMIGKKERPIRVSGRVQKKVTKHEKETNKKPDFVLN